MTIQEEISAYVAIQGKLEAEHKGEWVLIRDKAVIGFFPSFEQAATAAIRKFGRESYLIREIGAPPITLPASVMYRGDARR